MTPTFDCTYTKANNKNSNTYSGRITLDSGACLSVIHEKFLMQCEYQFTGKRAKEYSGAGGNRLPLLDDVVDVKVYVDSIGWVIFRSVLVLRKDSRLQPTMLIGRYDLQRLKIVLDFNKGIVRINLGPEKRSLPMIRKVSATVARVKRHARTNRGPYNPDEPRNNHQLLEDLQRPKPGQVDDPNFNNNDCAIAIAIEKRFGPFEAESINMISPEDPEQIQQSHQIPDDQWSTQAQLGDPCHFLHECCSGCDQCLDKKVLKWLEKNHKTPSLDDLSTDEEIVHSLRAYIERERQRSRSTFTHHQCTFDEDFVAKNPKTATKVKGLLEKYKQVFAGDIGEMGSEYEVEVKVTGDLSPQRPGHQKFQGTTLVAILKQFLKQIAHGVLVDVFEAGVVPKSYLNVLPIKKKDDDGKILEATSALRVVVDSTPVNAHTDFRFGSTDSLNDAVNFAAAASVKGFNFKADIGDAYYTIKMKKKMWGLFCVVVPFLGTYCYTRLVQGWMPSATFCQEILGRVFFELHKVMRRYMDDVIIASVKDGDHFANLVERFLQICLKNGLRLKGPKTFIGATSFKFLGRFIQNGQITASPHYLLNLLKVKSTDIRTRTQMRSYVMSFAFLAMFLHRSSELLKPLREVMIGDGKAKIEWTESLRQSFTKSQKALGELSQTYAFVPKYQTVIVVDSSKVATGGFVYQVGPNGPRLIGFFSRTRRDKERKVTLSSCHIELMGLKAMVVAYVPLLRQAILPVIVLTDNAPLAAIWTRFRKYELPSTDTRINNALFVLNQCADLRIQHTKHTNQKLRFADMLSRLNITRTADACEGKPKCTICQAADIEDDNPAQLIATVSELVKKEGNHGNILDGSESGNFGVPSDSWLFKPLQPSVSTTIGSVVPPTIALEKLLDDHKLLWTMQSADKRFCQLKKDIQKGRTSYPKKRTPMQTLLEKRKAKVVDGVIYLERNNQGVVRTVIPIPAQHAPEVVMVVHRAVGHASISQTVKQVLRHFEFQKPKEVVENALKHCVKCALLKGSTSYSKETMAPVPLPKDMFRTILVDEITRSIRQQPVKALIAIESVSGFMTAITFKKAMKGVDFVAAMGHVKAILCPHNMTNMVIQLRCDSAPWHTSATVLQGLQLMKIELVLHSSTTLSKNIVPDLDAKIGLFSKYLAQEAARTPKSMGLPLVCHLAAAKCNNTIGGTGYTPAELFVGRGWKNNETIQINVKQIIEGIAKRRATRRTYEDKKKLKKKQKTEQEMIPYSDPALNSALVRLPGLTELKAGDTVTLIQKADKNEPRAAWTVVNVDFKKRQAKMTRDSGLDTHRIAPKWVCFSRIEQIFPSETAILHLAVETGVTANPYTDELGIYRDPGRLRRFINAAVSAMAQFQATTAVPDEATFTSGPAAPVEQLITTAPAPTRLWINEHSDLPSQYGSSWEDVSDVPPVLMSTAVGHATFQPGQFSADSMSGPGTGATLSTDSIQKPSAGVRRDWTRGLGSYEEITTETLSDVMLRQPGQALHRLVSVPSGIVTRRPQRTPTPKRRKQPTPKSKTKTPAKAETKPEPKSEPEVKLEPKYTPIKNKHLDRNRSIEVKPGMAQSTPKTEPKARTTRPTTTSDRPKRSAKQTYSNFKGLC